MKDIKVTLNIEEYENLKEIESRFYEILDEERRINKDNIKILKIICITTVCIVVSYFLYSSYRYYLAHESDFTDYMDWVTYEQIQTKSK